jgi:hypothetical protein
MTWILVVVVVLVLLLGMVIFFYLHDKNHSLYDAPLLNAPALDAGEEYYEVLDLLAALPDMMEGTLAGLGAGAIAPRKAKMGDPDLL